jgi:hypothetical protein
MYYRQLKDFLKQSEQKAFWILTYANIAGIVAGFFAARYLAEALPGLPAPLLFPLGIVAGLLCTWPREARPFYKYAWLASRYTGRRILQPTALRFTGAADYQVPITGLRPLEIAGVLTYRGEGRGAP